MSGFPGRLSRPIGPLVKLAKNGNDGRADADSNFQKLRHYIDELTGDLDHRVPAVFNVMGFGAKGDGLTDDSTAIQRAVDAAVDYGSDVAADSPYAPTVYFGPGKYIINSNPFKNVIGTGSNIQLVLNGAVLNSSVQIKVPRQCVVLGTTSWNNSGFITRGSPAYVAAVSISSVVRTSNVVTVTTSSAHGLEANATVRLEGVTDSSFDGGWPLSTAPTTTTFTFAQTAGDATSSGGTCYIPFIVLGDNVGDRDFGCRLENIRVTMRDETGSVGVYSNNINEESGAENLNIQRAAGRGLWVEVQGAGALPRALNYRFENVSIGMTAGVGAIGIYLRGKYDQHRGFNNISIATSSIAVDSGATGIDMSGCPGVYSRIHIEGYTNGILIGNRGAASVAGEDSAAIVLDGISGQDTNTTLIRLKNYGEVHNIVCLGIAKLNGTNILVDEINSVTLTDTYLAFYAIGKTTTGALWTTSPNAASRFPATTSFHDVLPVTTDTYKVGTTSFGWQRIVVEHGANRADGLGLIQTLTGTQSPRLFFQNTTDAWGYALTGTSTSMEFRTGAAIGSTSGTVRWAYNTTALLPSSGYDAGSTSNPWGAVYSPILASGSATNLLLRYNTTTIVQVQSDGFYPSATDSRLLGSSSAGWQRIAIEHGASRADGLGLVQTLTGTDSPRLFFSNSTDAWGYSIRGSSGALIFATGATAYSASGTARMLLSSTEWKPNTDNAMTDGATASRYSTVFGYRGDFSTEVKSPILNSASATDLILQRNSNTGFTLGANDNVSALPIRLKNYTVATLPGGTQGDIAFVTDALAPTFLTAVAGGGGIVTPVFYDGTNWVAF